MTLRCPQCGKKNDGDGYATCAKCRKVLRDRRKVRTVSGVCAYGQCPEPTAAGTKCCARHREYYRQRCKAYRTGEPQPSIVAVKRPAIIDQLNDFDAIL